MTTQEIQATDEILGYTLKKRVGTGSYGEVWAADAPGGISKAVKFIYGCHNENRATTELKSLNKIKQVRHPFLLSLERIEVVNGRLVVISELADMSLNDRFLACCDEGLAGIPRDELLGYLKDAADALDYISESHSLQHLDIKPENLLLMGGHIKVADFGLVKEVRDATQSLMSGLTPAYAPPELFDGRPNRSSDQYSLAIVYAEMVCGKRPFGGTTAAQLAVQHMQGKPNLKQLPPADQDIVLKALAKDPLLRFPSCREFVEELISRQGRSAAEKRRRRNSTPQASDDAYTIQLPGVNENHSTNVASTQSLVGGLTPAVLEKKGPMKFDPSTANIRPTLFVGIGSTGTLIIRRLQSQIRGQIGELESLPAIGYLCIDSDRTSLIETAHGMHAGAINHKEILPIPLRKSEVYRNDANMHLNWLSRRWIYNIPRSLQTEGLRPLGRLAFVDNSDAFFSRVIEILKRITAAEALATTAHSTELNSVNELPRVFVVSSIAGGIGSGCAIDVAYALRVALAELGVPDDAVHGIMIHSTAKLDRDSQIAVANTYAFLSELQHYTTFGYPGDESCGLPPFDVGDAAFKRTYFVDLGTDICENDYDASISSIAEYLLYNSISRCAPFFDACRNADESDECSMRTLGVRSTELGYRGEAAEAGTVLTLMLLEEWLESSGFDAMQFVDRVCNQTSLTHDALVTKVDEALRDRHGNDVEHKIAQEFSDVVSQGATDQTVNWRLASATLDLLQGREPESTTEQSESSDSDTIEDWVAKTAHECGSVLNEAIAKLIDLPDARVGGAHEAHDAMCNRVRSLVDQLQQEMDANASQQTMTAETLDQLQKRPKDVEKVPALLATYAQLRLHSVVLASTRRLLVLIGSDIESSLICIVRARRQLEAIIDQVRAERGAAAVGIGSTDDTGASIPLGLDALMAKNVVVQLTSLLPRVNEQLERDFISPAGGLRNIMLDDASHLRRGFVGAISQASQTNVTRVMSNVNIDLLVRDSRMQPAELSDWMSKQLKSACPNALDHGGTSRLLLALPEATKSSALPAFIREKFGQDPTMIPGTKGDVVLAYEVANVPLANIAIGLLEEHPDCGEYVSRLHTRVDVEWSRLTDIT